MNTGLVPTNGNPSQDEERDAGGHSQEAVAQAAEQQAREQGVAPAHHVTPAALAAAHANKKKTHVANRICIFVHDLTVAVDNIHLVSGVCSDNL